MAEQDMREAVERLLELILDDDHRRLCQGREYTCECGYDQGIWDQAEAVRALISSTREGWRPIETAPKGGHFLGAYEDGTVVAAHYFDNRASKWPFKGVRPLYGVEKPGNRFVAWQPLPAAPCAAPIIRSDTTGSEGEGS